MANLIKKIQDKLFRAPGPDAHADKIKAILDLQSRFKIGTFIETGTYMGDTVEAVRGAFDKAISIELDTNLHQRAAKRFIGAPNVILYQGDSATMLPEILKTLDRPALFWLDGHFSGGVTARGPLETPIERELDAIFAHSVKGHAILIDDARLFDGTHDYPTIEAVKKKTAAAGFTCAKKGDLLMILPK
ncbi:MAG: hypothetical protein KGI45_01995 [Patescibacteria group bacterium]|nr:hypothetical protein [Patescibacteria group bacterium]MDE1941264.1 hypothetical protein [Patescibacteria group bacterium]MDE1966825.1 hypothetical protein [Patescibacteria group bacterium]